MCPISLSHITSDRHGGCAETSAGLRWQRRASGCLGRVSRSLLGGGKLQGPSALECGEVKGCVQLLEEGLAKHKPARNRAEGQGQASGGEGHVHTLANAVSLCHSDLQDCLNHVTPTMPRSFFWLV